MIKSGTRVSNPKGTGGFEFVIDYNYYMHGGKIDSYMVKPYGTAKRWGTGKPPVWLTDHISTANSHQQPSDYAWSEHVIPVVYKLDLGDRIYSIEDDENLYHVQLATLSDGEYFMRNILTTRWLWIARAYIRFHGWLS